jgi:hypothetical protein
VFYDGDPDSGGSIIGDTQTISDNLIPGGANEVSVSWDVPTDSSNSHEIFVVVDPCLAVDDRDRSNNTASKFAVLPDVEVKNSWSTELSPNSVMLIARIANTGVTAAKHVTVSWRIGSREGTEIGSDLIGTLACDGVYEASCVLDVNGVFDSNGYVKVFGVVSSASGVPDFDERNNAFSLLVNNPSPESHPLAEAGPDQTVYALIDCIVDVILDGSASYDEDGDELTYKWSWIIDGNDYEAIDVKPTIELPVGQHTIQLIVNDGIVDSEPDYVVITVIDNTPPEFSLFMEPNVLWPPNHKMMKVTPTWTVTDNCDESPTISLVNITMNEGDVTNTFDPIYDVNVIDGLTVSDIQIGSDGSIYLRAERSGNSSGRLYTITYKAVDDSGNATIKSATVTVPHDQR